MDPRVDSPSGISKFRRLKHPQSQLPRKKTWKQGFPIDVRPILYAPGAGADKVGTPTGSWQIAMNPTARFNVKPEKATEKRPMFNNNAAIHEALASSRLGKEIKCWLCCHACTLTAAVADTMSSCVQI